jgi:hypothetical protein
MSPVLTARSWTPTAGRWWRDDRHASAAHGDYRGGARWLVSFVWRLPGLMLGCGRIVG